MSTRRPKRWGDNDRYFGPFTFARGGPGDRSYALVLSSGDDERPGCDLRLTVRGHTLLVALPPALLRPWRERVVPGSWDAATVARLGRNWYWNVNRRQIGASLSDGHLSLYYGRQSDDSRTERRWGCFLPWTQWRHVRWSLYGLAGEHVWTEPAHAKGRAGLDAWQESRRHVEACPTRAFAFADYDSEPLSARTRIEEREWRFGAGWFRWLAWFRRPRVVRSLDIEFSGETGRRKGSWKGGTIGHSIEMRPGELHEAAFRRYCAEHQMVFQGDAGPTPAVALASA